ncbi:conserved Plasmodium protein, unknown function [Plasmodium vinckei]|uniref:Uncharacterized protein n=1 Tax=Plasmodium vinckei TaxID=5860 RepID=A0A6V7T3A4_PLAVN|nr:conserved Plasmodium protein, unknown function [Plasmodium vinckei]
MKTNTNCFFLYFNKRYYNPPNKRKWSKQNDKYKTRRPLAESFNMHKINIKGEYWKQKHVDKQFVVENGNQDMINEKTSLNFFGYPNISLHNKLGGSLYIEQMDPITLCIIMNKCIKENICESYIWSSLLNRCTKIAHKINGNLISYIFKYSSQSEYYSHYFFLTMLGNISSYLYSLNLKCCANILYAMNNNSNFYNEEIYNKTIEHSSLLILNRNDIDINSVLSIINSFYPFRDNNSNSTKKLEYSNIQKYINNAYILFDSISKTFNRYDLDLSEIDSICSTLLVYCMLNRINIFFQEKNISVVNKLLNYLNNNIEKLNIKHISILCYTHCIFKNKIDLQWNNIYKKIESDCYLLDNDYISILFYSMKNNILKKNIIYNNLLNNINSTSLDNISLIANSFLKSTDMAKQNNPHTKGSFDLKGKLEGRKKNGITTSSSYVKETEIKNNMHDNNDGELKLSYSFNLFNNFLYGKIKYNINNFNAYQIYLIFKGLCETKLENDKVADLKINMMKEINKHIYTMPIYLLSYFAKIFTDNYIKENDLINSIKDISLIYLSIYKNINIHDSEYTINENSTLIEEYYKNASNDKKNIKNDINFIYNEKTKEISYLSDKYLIDLNLYNTQFKILNEKFGITNEQIEKTFQNSQDKFFNYYLNEKNLSNFIYFCTILDNESSIPYFNEIKTIVENKIMDRQLKFTPSNILYIFKTLDHFNFLNTTNTFFNLLLKQLCEQIFSINTSTFLAILQLFYKHKISHYYFLKKSNYIINMNRYELDQNSLVDIKNMIFELKKLL